MTSQAELRAILSPTAALAIPGGQAILTGAACGVIGGSLAKMTGGDPLAIGGLSCGLGFGGGLLFGLSWWRGRVSAILGELQATAAYTYPVETVRLEVIGNPESSYPWGEWLDLTIDPDALRDAFYHLATGGDLSMSAMAGKGKPLSRSEFTTLRDGLIKSGLAYWENPRAHAQGCRLNLVGKNVIRRYAELPHQSEASRLMLDM